MPVNQIVSVFDYSDLDIDDTDGAIIKRIVEDPIYVGRVVYPRTADESEQAVKEDSNLQLISEDLFEEVNDTVENIAEKHSTTTDSVDIEKLADMGLIMKALDEIDTIKPICDHCGRGMEKNGSETLKDGSKCHYWICPKYNNDGSKDHDQKKFPREKEWELLKSHAENENSDVVILRIKHLTTSISIYILWINSYPEQSLLNIFYKCMINIRIHRQRSEEIGFSIIASQKL